MIKELKDVLSSSLLNKDVRIRWVDSYGVLSGWQDISTFNAQELVITTWGRVIYQDEKVLSIAHNYAEETDNTPEQVNGIMTIPLTAIKEITFLSSYLAPEQQLKQR